MIKSFNDSCVVCGEKNIKPVAIIIDCSIKIIMRKVTADKETTPAGVVMFFWGVTF